MKDPQGPSSSVELGELFSDCDGEKSFGFIKKDLVFQPDIPGRTEVTENLAAYWACKKEADPSKINCDREKRSVSLKVGKEKETYDVLIEVIVNNKAIAVGDELYVSQYSEDADDDAVRPPSKRPKSTKGKASKGKGKGRGRK